MPPRAQRYPPIQTVLTHEEADYLEACARGKLVLDVGSERGYGTIFMARVASHVHSVDWHCGDPPSINPLGGSLGSFFMHLELNGLLSKVTAHVGRIDEVLPLFRPGLFDLAVVDGSPGEQVHDLQLVAPLMKEQGWIVTRDNGRSLQLERWEFPRWTVSDHCGALLRLTGP